MISYITGEILKRGESERHSWVDVLTQSGVGYRVLIPSNVSFDAQKSELFTSFQVREDSQVLYGFSSPLDRDFFELLITVSGVGPKLAISIMSVYTTDQIKSLIVKKDHESLSKVGGLGKKGSQKIIVELESKLEGFVAMDGVESSSSILKELKVALKSLGFSGEGLEEYVSAAQEILSEKPETSLEELIKLVLKSK